ncbi:hypothetical protein [Paracoccus sp. IB05]
MHIAAVERAGIRSLPDGQKISSETEAGRGGKISAVDLELR